MFKSYKNLVVGLNFLKCSVQIFGNLYIGQYLRKILFLAKISKFRICQNFGNCIYFCHFFIISNLVKIMVNLDFFFELSKNHDFSEIYEICQICSKFSEKY